MPVENTTHARKVTVAIIHHTAGRIRQIEIMPQDGPTLRADLDDATAAALGRIIQATEHREATQ